MATQRASFDDIAASCGNLKNLATAVDKTGDSTQDAVGKIKDPTWDGDAARAYATDLKKLVDNLPEANRQLALSVLFLASCADGYEKLGEDSVKALKDIIGGQEYIDKYDVDRAPTPDLNARIADIYDKAEEKAPEDKTKKEDNSKGDSKDDNNNSNNNNNNNNNNNHNNNNNNNKSKYPYAAVPPVAEKKEEEEPKKEEEKKEEEEDSGLKKNITKIDYSNLEKDKLDDTGKALVENEKYKDEKGLSKVGDYYLITCNENVGKVGDVIQITLKDGKTITCIVAANTTDSTVNFIKTGSDFEEPTELKNLLDNATKVENLGNCKDKLGIDLTAKKTSSIDMENYPKEQNDPEAALERGTLVAKYLMENGDFTAEQAAALAGVYVNENGCNPGEINSGVTEREKIIFGNGYGVGIGSWTTTSVKNTVLTDAGYSTSTPIESLSLKEQCDMIIETSKKSNKTYYDALKRCNNVEDASATAAVMTGGVGFSSNWETHPTAADAKNMADYYAEANDRIYGYNEFHHNADERRLATAKEILERLQK